MPDRVGHMTDPQASRSLQLSLWSSLALVVLLLVSNWLNRREQREQYDLLMDLNKKSLAQTEEALRMARQCLGSKAPPPVPDPAPGK
jgi:hypothetical protein